VKKNEIEVSALEIGICFGFRASDFGFIFDTGSETIQRKTMFCRRHFQCRYILAVGNRS